jgi:hypothetical protein
MHTTEQDGVLVRNSNELPKTVDKSRETGSEPPQIKEGAGKPVGVWGQVEQEVSTKRQAIVAALQDLDGKTGMLELEGMLTLL